jgi:alpha-tubulin suppressor-like RCC1 family protein
LRPAFTISNAVSIAAEQTSTLVLLKNGTVMGWGEDDFGELGDGQSNPEVPAPVVTKNLSGVLQLAAGGGFGLAIVPGP